MDEDILYRTAVAYHHLLTTKYRIVLGRKGKTFEIFIEFTPENFFHLAGLHKLSQRYSSLLRTSEEILHDAVSGTLSAEIFRGDIQFETVKRRMRALQSLEEMLDSDRVEFYGFNNRKALIGTKITADYLAKEENREGLILFSFFEENGGRCYAKSVFSKETYDYTLRQVKYTVLQKEKIADQVTMILFRHKAYGLEKDTGNL